MKQYNKAIVLAEIHTMQQMFEASGSRLFIYNVVGEYVHQISNLSGLVLSRAMAHGQTANFY